MIEINNLTKQFGKNKAVCDITFKVEKGEILGFLGPNGAGKTTTMNIITGYISKTSGQILINGINFDTNPNECKKKIGYLPEIPPLYPNMTVLEYLDFVCDIKGVKENKRLHIDEICNKVKIDDVKNRLIKNLSKGYKQRAGIAQSLISNPEILILDEPTVGLDPKQIVEIRNLIKELGKDKTVILSSHILSEISAICDKVVIINNGEIVATDTPDKLLEKFNKNEKYTIRVSGNENDIYNLIINTLGVKAVTKLGSIEENAFDFLIETDGKTDIRKSISTALIENDFSILMIVKNEISLEDVFIKLTDKETKEEEHESNI